MKSILPVLALLLSLSSHSQDIPVGQVPAVVLKTFKSYFPEAGKTEWEKKGNRYEAAFDVKRADHKALFEEKGKLIIYKYDIPAGQLPAAVRQTIRHQYKGYRIDEIERVAKDGHVLYQVELDGQPDLKLVFNRDGTVNDTQAWW